MIPNPEQAQAERESSVITFHVDPKTLIAVLGALNLGMETEAYRQSPLACVELFYRGAVAGLAQACPHTVAEMKANGIEL